MDELLQKALDDYKKQTGADFDPSWQPTCAEDLAKRVRASSAEFERWRSRHAPLWRSLSACLGPINSVASIASGPATNLSPGAGVAIGGILSILKACEGVSDAYNYVEEMFAKFEDIFRGWSIDAKHEVDSFLKEKMQKTMVIILAILARSRALIHGSRMKQYFRILAFGKDDKVQDLVHQLESILREESRARSALTLDRVNALWEMVSDDHKRTDEKRTLSLLESPAVELTNATFEEKEKVLLQDSGKWFEQELLYQSWIRNERRVLLTMGGPGAGKSFLATGLIKELKRRYPQRQQEAAQVFIAYFYLDKNSTTSTALKTMANQLQLVCMDFRSHIIESMTDRTLHTSESIWENLFVDFWDINKTEARVILIFDGLDEVVADERASIAEFVKATIDSSSIAVQIAIFGRLTLRYDLDFIPVGAFVEVSSSKNTNDISAYINRGMAKVRVLKKANAVTKEAYRLRILERSDGVFEWARLFLAKIQNKEKSQINAILDKPPKDLDAMIESCFSEIHEDEDIDALTLKLLLIWNTYAKRPLYFIELYHVVRTATGELHELLWLTLIGKLASIFRCKTARLKGNNDENSQDDAIEVLEEVNGWSYTVEEAIVGFCHKRIQDYVVEQSHVQESQPEPHLFPELEAISQLEMVKSCFKIMQQADVTKERTFFYLDYPSRYFHVHLETLDIHSLGTEDLNEVIKGLIFLFFDPKGSSELLEASSYSDSATDSFWRAWIATPHYVELVQQYLLKAEGPFDDPSVNEWIREGSGSIKAFLRPITMTASKIWLCQPFDPKPMEYYDRYFGVSTSVVSYLKGLTAMTDKGLLDSKLKSWTTFDMYNTRNELEDIKRIAEWSNLPKDATWYTSFGLELHDHGWYTESTNAFETAVALDDQAWMACYRLGECYARHSDKLDQALRFAKRAKEICPQYRGFIDSRSATWYISKRDTDTAVRLAAEAFNADPENCLTQDRYLLLLALYGNAKDLVNVFRTLESRRLENFHGQKITLESHNEFAGCLSCQPRAWNSLGVALRTAELEDDRSFILNAVENAAKIIAENDDEYDQIWFCISLALWYRNHRYEHPDPALELMKNNLQRAKNSDILLDLDDRLILQAQISAHISKLLFEKARLQHAASDAGLIATIQELKELATEVENVHIPQAAGFTERCLMTPSMMYGRWLREYENGKDWKGVIRPHLASHVAMLDDSDPLNDYEGISHTAAILFHAGDRLNAGALITALVLRAEAAMNDASKAPTLIGSSLTEEPAELEGSMEQIALHGSRMAIPERSASLRLKVNDNVDLSCAVCTISFKNAKALWRCEFCVDLSFCEECLPELKAHPFRGKSCHSGHDRYQIWPISKEVRNLAVVQDGNDTWLKQEWLDKLKRKWDID